MGVAYNGQGLSLRERIGRFLLAGSAKASGEENLLSGRLRDDEWNRYDFFEPTVSNLIDEGQKKNAVVVACLSALTFAFPEPPMKLYRVGAREKLTHQPKHQIQKLVNKPNSIMGYKELAAFVAAYLAIGGNCYLWKRRDTLGFPYQLWPYHAAQIAEIPGGDEWLQGYMYLTRDGKKIPIPREDIIHLKWPLPDPNNPWRALAPLMSASREVAQDNEMTRYIYSLLSNDAVPRNALTVPYQLSDLQVQALENQWYRKHGKEGRGGLAVLEGGLALSRVALDMEELATEALRDVPESRICSVLRVPAQVAGVNVGMRHATYSNFEEANQAFTLKTMVTLWKIMSDEMERDLIGEFEGEEAVGSWRLMHDLSEVAALMEDQNAKSARVVAEYQAEIIELNEARTELNYPELSEEDLKKRAEAAAERMRAAQEAMGAGEQTNDDDGQEDDNDNDKEPAGKKYVERFMAELSAYLDTPRGQKDEGPFYILGLPNQRLEVMGRWGETKAVSYIEEQRIIRRLIKQVTPVWREAFEQQAKAVIERLREELPKGSHASLLSKAPAGFERYWDEAAETERMFEAYKATMEPVIKAGADVALKKLGRETAIDARGITERLAERVKGINDTTRKLIAQEIADGLRAGFTVDQIVDGVESEGFAGIKGIYEDIDRSRAVTIARSESAIAYNTGSVKVYGSAGVQRVKVNDGDFDEACAEADGQIWTLEEAEARPIEHPNCIRTFDPIIGE